MGCHFPLEGILQSPCTFWQGQMFVEPTRDDGTTHQDLLLNFGTQSAFSNILAHYMFHAHHEQTRSHSYHAIPATPNNAR